MIHLDANFLIGSLLRSSRPSAQLKVWLQRGETFASSSIAWAEFMHGPVRLEQIKEVENLIQGNVVAFGRREAEISSELFNQTGRRRGSQPDCFIAATAIHAQVFLATQNRKDFSRFVPFGLRLA